MVNVRAFNLSGRAKKTVKTFEEWGKVEILNKHLSQCYPYGVDEKELNRILWLQNFNSLLTQ